MVMMEIRKKLSPRLIASLDFARAISACYVVLHHVANSHGWSHGLGLAFRFGQEAVLVFFLLSGFVIFANERTRAIHPRGYYLRRFRRIYPALIVSLLVSTLVAVTNGNFQEQFRWHGLFGTLLSLQDLSHLKPGVIVNPYLGNEPLWSLSYEVAFYLAFPFVLRFWLLHPSWANHAVGTACCAGYMIYVMVPNHWALVTAYFLVWWCGAMAAEGYQRGGRDFRSIGSPLYWLLFLCGIAGASVPLLGYRGLGFYPFLLFRHFIFSGFLLLLLFNTFGANLAQILSRFAKPAGAVASISYGLYVLHFPLLVTCHWAQSELGTAAALVMLLLLAYLSDRQLSQFLPRAPIR